MAPILTWYEMKFYFLECILFTVFLSFDFEHLAERSLSKLVQNLKIF